MFRTIKFIVTFFLLIPLTQQSHVYSAAPVGAMGAVEVAAGRIDALRNRFGFLRHNPHAVDPALIEQRADLALRQRNIAQRLDANPADAALQLQIRDIDAQMIELNRQVAAQEEARIRMEERGAGVVAGMLNAAIGEQAAADDRKKAAVQAIAKGRIANQGAMDKIQFLTSKENITKLSIALAAVGGGLIATYFIAKFAMYYAQRFVGMPELIRESSEKTLWQWLVSLFQSEEEAVAFFADAIFDKETEGIIGELAQSFKDSRDANLQLRHILFYGVPGTGKTMIAKKIAHFCGMDYAIFSGADIMQFDPSERVVQINALFERAKQSKKGMIIFIDEAEAFFASDPIAVKAFLFHTGTNSKQFTCIYSANRVEDIPTPVISRTDKTLEIKLPAVEERARMLMHYLNDFFIKNPLVLGGEQAVLSPALTPEAINAIAAQLQGWSGRDIVKLVIEIPYILSSKKTRVVVPEIIQAAIEEKQKQRRNFIGYDSTAAMRDALRAPAASGA
jgi:hypothetical protein